MANFDWLQFLFLLRASFFISKWGSRLMVIHKIHWVSQIIWFAVKLIKTTRISALEVCVAVMGANWFWFRKFPLWFLDIDGIVSLPRPREIYIYIYIYIFGAIFLLNYYVYHAIHVWDRNTIILLRILLKLQRSWTASVT
jgi:hypothetical protein